ncbi:MAG: lipocalin family protein [Solirubrobacteraceae bacterium]|nr:lipocalin family protein [Solirubrobacteraceae bacterium]
MPRPSTSTPSSTRPLRASSKQRRARRLLVAALGASALAPAAASAATDPAPIVPVPSVDVQRYLGDWKQVAAIPQWFEALCERDVTANYVLRPDGAVGVKNVCKGPFGASIVANGRARILDKTTNSQLQVSFAQAFGQWFYPNSTPNYVIVGLGANYDWAVVGSPERSSAFVLSRTATLTPAQRSAVLSTLSTNGFDACKLKTTKQTGGATAATPFCQG